jgi:CRP/FNR family cyclic AMP-dependent transcriptional regulator
MEIWLRPYMRSKRYKPGSMVFAAGDQADRLYFVASGDVELPEVGASWAPARCSARSRFLPPTTGAAAAHAA